VSSGRHPAASQAVATDKASSSPVSLRSAPGRASSLSARSRLLSTKRRLIRYTVDGGDPSANSRGFKVDQSPKGVHLRVKGDVGDKVLGMRDVSE
jgi:hypothetical protein